MKFKIWLSSGQEIEVEGADIFVYPEGELIVSEQMPATFEGGRQLTRAKQRVVFRARPDGWSSYRIIEEEE